MNGKEQLFQLQVFQQTISTFYMYPLRVYKNDCYDRFVQHLNNKELFPILAKALDLNPTTSPSEILEFLRNTIKEEPSKIFSNEKLYQILEDESNYLRKFMWETQASNSLVFTREIKSHKPLWMFLMIYDLVSSSFIEENFSDVHATQCLLNMQIFYVKLNHAYSLSIGRFLPESDEDQLEIVKNILENYGFEGMNVFELMTLVKKRKTFETELLAGKIKYIQKAFKLFFEVQEKLIEGLPKDELVLIFLFICMATDNREREEIFLQTKNYCLRFKNDEVTIEQNIANESQSQNFKKRLLYFQNNADFFRTEYASRLMNSLAKRYSGFQDNNYSIVDDLLQHICRRVNAECRVLYQI